MTKLERAQGCLLGQLAGDSLGSLVEFKSASTIAKLHPDGGPRLLVDGGVWRTLAGQPTDDSELALALARSLVELGRYDEDAVAQAYGDWYNSNPFDVGTTTSMALEGCCESASLLRKRANDTSQANGSLMRSSPLGIFLYESDPAELLRIARADSTLTHPHAVCQDAVAAFVFAIAYAIREGGSPQAVHAATVTWAASVPLHAKVLGALNATTKPADYWEHMGYVITALRNAFYRLLHSANLEEGIVETIHEGGDTDTTAAIAGALLGAVYGRSAVPQQWVDSILKCRPQAGLPHVIQDRPEIYWPVDALELAEKLSAPSTAPIVENAAEKPVDRVSGNV